MRAVTTVEPLSSTSVLLGSGGLVDYAEHNKRFRHLSMSYASIDHLEEMRPKNAEQQRLSESE